MSDETITIEIPLGMAADLAADPGAWPAGYVAAACRTALAKRQVDARAERLGLPWAMAEDGPGDGPTVSVHFTGMREDKVAQNVTYGLYGCQARLMAAAPDLAEALEEVVRCSDMGCDAADLEDIARVALVKSGWRDG